jgi:TolB protein
VKNLIGQTLLNQFRVDAFVASGGMGVVYRVWDLKRSVALAMKVLHADLAEDPSLFKRFQREARALQKLTHPNIVPFYGIYQTGGLVFLLERYIDGPSLKEILRNYRDQPLPLQEVFTYLKALCAAVGYAHANGVIHCDIKPGNVMVDQGGNIYLTDFGIARHAESTTTTMATAGTAAYMAPEQIRGEAVRPETDVYALGIVLFETLTGQRPFRGIESGTESAGRTANERIRHAHLALPPPDPSTINNSISKPLGQVVLTALAKAPQDRFSSTQALFAATCAATGVRQEEIADRAIIVLQKTYPTSPAPVSPELTPPIGQVGQSMPRRPEAVALPKTILNHARAKQALFIGLPTILVLLFLFVWNGSNGPANPTSSPTNPTEVAAARTITPTEQVVPPPTETPGETSTSTLPPTLSPSPSGTPSPTPAPNSPFGKIVYTCQIFYDESRDQLCIINADGTGFRRLTVDVDYAKNYYASLAPDGKSVVFSSDRTGRKEIYESDLMGNARQLTDGLGEEAVAPEISPDGEKIVFTLKRNGRFGVWLMDRDGSDPRPVVGGATGDEAWDPTWPPEDSKVLFSSNRGGSVQLYVIDLDNSKVRKVSDLSSQRGRSDWSPDGTIISTYAGRSWHREIYFMDPDGASLRQITNGGNNLAPSFSPDGRWFAFTSYMDNYMVDPGCEIYIMSVDGGDPIRLTDNDYCDYQPRWGP